MNNTHKNTLDQVISDWLNWQNRYMVLFSSFISMFEDNESFLQFAEGDRHRPKILIKDIDMANFAFMNRYLIRDFFDEREDPNNWYCVFTMQENIETFYEHAWSVIGDIVFERISDSFYTYLYD